LCLSAERLSITGASGGAVSNVTLLTSDVVFPAESVPDKRKAYLPSAGKLLQYASGPEVTLVPPKIRWVQDVCSLMSCPLATSIRYSLRRGSTAVPKSGLTPVTYPPSTGSIQANWGGVLSTVIGTTTLVRCLALSSASTITTTSPSGKSAIANDPSEPSTSRSKRPNSTSLPEAL